MSSDNVVALSSLAPVPDGESLHFSEGAASVATACEILGDLSRAELYRLLRDPGSGLVSATIGRKRVVCVASLRRFLRSRRDSRS